MYKKLLNVLIIFVCTSGTGLHGKVILWDLGGVLFHPNKLGVAKEIGFSNFVTYMLLDWKTPNIQGVLFSVLEQMMPPEREEEREQAGTAEGTPLPTIMCHWQAGTITGPEIIKRSKAHIAALHKHSFFESNREMTLVKKTIKAMFNPDVLARNVYPIKQGMKLLQDCASAKTKDGKKKNRNFAFSNWDPLSFDKFYAMQRSAFQHFEQIVISGHIKRIKPRKEAYEYLFTHCKLDPKECILIDDQRVNAIGAQKCGIKTILVEDGDYESVRRQLVAMGAL